MNRRNAHRSISSPQGGWTILQSSSALGIAAAITVLLAGGTEPASIHGAASVSVDRRAEYPGTALASPASSTGQRASPADRVAGERSTTPATHQNGPVTSVADAGPDTLQDTRLPVRVGQSDPHLFQILESSAPDAFSLSTARSTAGGAQGKDDQSVFSVQDWDRGTAVDELERLLQEWKIEGWQRAEGEGWEPVGEYAGEGGFELMRVRQQTVYAYGTDNSHASISSAADSAAANASISLNGAGVLVGIWDQGSVRSTHQEVSGRVTVGDGANAASHATHAGGTIAASGVSASARGMAPAAELQSFDWSSDIAEMTSMAMSTPAEAGTVQISSHSYGYISGWAPQYSPPRWFGTAGDVESENFGQYEWYASKWDELCYNAPYYLPFKSAGNNRIDAAPSPGANFAYYDNGWQTKAYDPAVDPGGDGDADAGFDSIPMIGNAKNVMTVGAVNDAVSGGTRSLQAATMTTFSGWGPADDGRIKPDIVANGAALYSSRASSDSSYGYMTGTSMSTPSAAGSAALLIELYSTLFSGDALPASMLKGLILHTADDLGNPGPDYKFGWGLMNTMAAADLIDAHALQPDALHLSTVTLTNQQSNTILLDSNGLDPITVTICWTDPAGQQLYELDNRTPRLVHDIDLRIIDPTGKEHFPFVLDPVRPDAIASAADNDVDNVEQIRIVTPSGAGTYQIVVRADGDLANGIQDVSVIISGLSATSASRRPPSLTLNPSVQVAGDGTGLVTVSGVVDDDEDDVCSLEVEYSTDAGETWLHATVSDAACAQGALPVNNQDQAQITQLSPNGATSFWVTWDSRNSVNPVITSYDTQVRVRAWDGFEWSEWAATPSFLVDNQGPDVLGVGNGNGGLAFDRYLVDSAVTLSLYTDEEDDSGIAGFYIAVGSSDLASADFTADPAYTVTDLTPGEETTITVWAVDGSGNVGARYPVSLFLLDPNGNWDGVSEIGDGGLAGLSQSGDTGDPPRLSTDIAGGTPVLRWRLTHGQQYRIETCSDLADPAGWAEEPSTSFSVDDGWVVWAHRAGDGEDAEGMGFFRVLEISPPAPTEPPTQPSEPPPPPKPKPKPPAFDLTAFIQWLWNLILQTLFGA